MSVTSFKSTTAICLPYNICTLHLSAHPFPLRQSEQWISLISKPSTLTYSLHAVNDRSSAASRTLSRAHDTNYQSSNPWPTFEARGTTTYMWLLLWDASRLEGPTPSPAPPICGGDASDVCTHIAAACIEVCATSPDIVLPLFLYLYLFLHCYRYQGIQISICIRRG